MGLITKEIEVVLNGSNIARYENLGYSIPRYKNKQNKLSVKMGTKITVKVADLSEGSSVGVDIQCDGCSKVLANIPWIRYIKLVKTDGTYYCQKCAVILFGHENMRKNLIKTRKTFYDWCIENDRQDILDRWDYELNDLNPTEITYATKNKIYFKCPRDIHKSKLQAIYSITKDKNSSIICHYCNSFAQVGIDNICTDFLEKYWDWDKNNEIGINPWKTAHSSKNQVYLKCQKTDYHGSYKTTCNNFNRNKGCPYCNTFASKKVHKLDSLGYLYPQITDVWSDKNKRSPYKYSTYSSQEVWWKCPEGLHADYKRSINSSNNYEFRCPDCSREKNESFLQEKIRLYINTFNYLVLHENNCTIKCKNPKTNYLLPYDNEIKELRLIIEVHGKQHYIIDSFHSLSAKYNNTTPEQQLEYQQWKDKYKKDYALSQGYFYLEVPYWADNENETWKELINNKIDEINKINIKQIS